MAHYLDDAQCKALMRRAKSWLWCSECPTWLLIVAVHTSRFGIALHATQLGLLATTTLLTLATTWYTSAERSRLRGSCSAGCGGSVNYARPVRSTPESTSVRCRGARTRRAANGNAAQSPRSSAPGNGCTKVRQSCPDSCLFSP